jgi:hypothetical protein
MCKRGLIALLGGCLPLWAWGPEGHDLVARIAEAQLTDAARAQVAAILGPGTSLASISSWADQIRRSRADTAPWHYIDIPIDKPHLDMARDCPKGDCVIAAIEKFETTLRDPAAPADQRKEALMFVVHFIGDMHQPLHCSDNKDHGGNTVQVQYMDKPWNLHSLWDGAMLAHIGTEEQLFPQWSSEALHHAKKWSKGTVEQWAEESHKAAQKVTYGRLPKVAPGTRIAIDATYEQKADPLIREQIEKAGDRLARTLNDCLKPQS